MNIGIQQMVPMIGCIISISGIIFKTGQHAEKLDILTNTVHAQELKVSTNFNIINDIHNDISILKNDISYMKDDLHHIKTKLEN
jgi:hypothetical protein|tara:strand:- start:3416 stop:3667 length:252 start_codon:yes stop_codon:yes gene_type:complete